jgi:chorismate mutase
MPELVTLGPFTADRKAVLVQPGRADLAGRLDAWLLARERDGSLAALRREHLGARPWSKTAEPLAALMAAIDERLSLMPMVAYVKRETGVPLEVPEREDAVLDAAATSVLEAASVSERVPPPFTLIRAFYQAQMDAAKQIQVDALRQGEDEPPDPLPDLDQTLRPALLRIGDKIARLILELPPSRQSERVGVLAESLLREPHLAHSSRRGIVEALVRLMPTDRGQARVSARASSPAATGSTTQTP